MPAENRTTARARRQVWHSVQDNNSAASQRSAEAIPASSIAGCRAVAGRSSDRRRLVAGTDWKNHAPSWRDETDRCSDWRPRIFATASGSKRFNYNGSGGCSIARGERGCGVCEPTVCEHCHGFQPATGFIAGSSADSDIECPIAVRCSQRFRSKFASSDRGKFTLFCGRDEVILAT